MNPILKNPEQLSKQTRIAAQTDLVEDEDGDDETAPPETRVASAGLHGGVCDVCGDQNRKTNRPTVGSTPRPVAFYRTPATSHRRPPALTSLGQPSTRKDHRGELGRDVGDSIPVIRFSTLSGPFLAWAVTKKTVVVDELC